MRGSVRRGRFLLLFSLVDEGTLDSKEVAEGRGGLSRTCFTRLVRRQDGWWSERRGGMALFPFDNPPPTSSTALVGGSFSLVPPPITRSQSRGRANPGLTCPPPRIISWGGVIVKMETTRERLKVSSNRRIG